MHQIRDQSILAPNFTVELVHDDHVAPVEVDLHFYRGYLEGQFSFHCFSTNYFAHNCCQLERERLDELYSFSGSLLYLYLHLQCIEFSCWQ